MFPKFALTCARQRTGPAGSDMREPAGGRPTAVHYPSASLGKLHGDASRGGLAA
jgi:hypothetical protein